MGCFRARAEAILICSLAPSVGSAHSRYPVIFGERSFHMNTSSTVQVPPNFIVLIQECMGNLYTDLRILGARAVVPKLFGARNRFCGRQFFHGWGAGGGDGSGGNASDGEQQMKRHSLARLPLTSCCVARFLTGQGPVVVHGPGLGTSGLEH